MSAAPQQHREEEKINAFQGIPKSNERPHVALPPSDPYFAKFKNKRLQVFWHPFDNDEYYDLRVTCKESIMVASDEKNGFQGVASEPVEWMIDTDFVGDRQELALVIDFQHMSDKRNSFGAVAELIKNKAQNLEIEIRRLKLRRANGTASRQELQRLAWLVEETSGRCGDLVTIVAKMQGKEVEVALGGTEFKDANGAPLLAPPKKNYYYGEHLITIHWFTIMNATLNLNIPQGPRHCFIEYHDD